MSFAQPLMLFGLLAALIPIIIHLIHKRRPRKQAFGAIEFVIRSVQRVQRRWRLRRFLLLASRVLILVALALAAARPLFGDSPEAAGKRSGPERIVLVIDASLSMQARPEKGQSGFEQAVKKARVLIESLGAEDQMMLVLAKDKAIGLLPNFSASKPDLLRALARAKVAYAYVDLSAAVSYASQLLNSKQAGDSGEAESPTQAKRIVVLSDLSVHGFQESGVLGSDIALNLYDVFDELEAEERINYGITALSVSILPSSLESTVQALVRVRSFIGDTESDNTSVSKNIDLLGPEGVALEAGMQINSGQLSEKTLNHPFSADGRFGIAVQVEPDFLAEDDIRFAQVDVQNRVLSLIVDGAPSGLPKEDEVFYLERALATGAKDQPRPKVIVADELAAEDLSKYRVLILAGVSSLSGELGQRIVEFVEGGGGLLITATENLDVDQYNAVLGRILPRALRGIKRRNALQKRSKDDDSVLLAEIDQEHPVMTGFEGDALSGLRTTRTQAYFLLQPDRNRRAKVIASFEDGQPALIEARIKRGRVILLTTSIDRDLSDLAIRPAFVPLMRHLLLYLCGALSRPDPRMTFVGQARTLRLPAADTGSAWIEVVGPGGTTSRLAVPQDSNSVVFEAGVMPGHYEVFLTRDGQRAPILSESFSVNIDPRESDLAFLSASRAEAVLRGSAENRSASGEISGALSLNALGASNPDRIAQVLLILMLLAFVFESLLTKERRVLKDKAQVSRVKPAWMSRFLGG
jgi:hypothetical protein